MFTRAIGVVEENLKMNRVYNVALILLLFSVAFVLIKTAKAQDNSVRLLGTCKIPGTATDLSGLEQPLVPADGVEIDEIPVPRTFHNNMFGGISAIAWSGGKRCLLAAARSRSSRWIGKLDLSRASSPSLD